MQTYSSCTATTDGHYYQLTVLRQNIYTDPRKPVAVAPGLKVYGTPDENSPVLFTSNFALTYYTVASDIESNKLNAYLIVVETEGSAIDSGVAGRKLTAERVADAIKAIRRRKQSQTPQNHHPRQSITHQRRNRRTQRLESPSWTTRQQRDTEVSHREMATISHLSFLLIFFCLILANGFFIQFISAISKQI